MSSAKQVLQGLIGQLLAEATGEGRALLGNALANVVANPSTQNVIAQGAAIALVAPTLLPGIEAEAIKRSAQAGQELLALLEPKGA